MSETHPMICYEGRCCGWHGFNWTMLTTTNPVNQGRQIRRGTDQWCVQILASLTFSSAFTFQAFTSQVASLFTELTASSSRAYSSSLTSCSVKMSCIRHHCTRNSRATSTSASHYLHELLCYVNVMCAIINCKLRCHEPPCICI